MSEINYAFDNLYATNSSWTDADRQIANTLSDYWVNFIATGDPNGAGLAEWPASANGSLQTMTLGDSFGVISLADEELEEKVSFIAEFFAKFPAW